MARRRNKHLGFSFDEFLRSEGLCEEVTTLAWKRVLSWEVTEAMKKEGISKSEMAKRMGTSRSHLERRLDPENPNVMSFDITECHDLTVPKLSQQPRGTAA